MSILDGLNPEQRRAVVHEGGPLLILAGAGSGKTRVLVHRVAYVLDRGAPPGSVLAITFTNRAAAEMRERVEALVGVERASELSVGTFHAACVRILRREAHRVGVARDFAIADADDQKAVATRCLKELNLDTTRYSPAAVVAAISSAKDELLGPGEFERRASDPYRRRIAEVYALYQDRLARSGALDFGDLIATTVRLFEEEPAVLEKYAGRFRHILVDEYQDTNHAQYVLVRMLASRHRNLVCVGDDDQSIYRWRGADLRNILDFEKDFPDATVIKLERNYRSTGNILRAANSVVHNNVRRKGKVLWTERLDGEKVMLGCFRDEGDEAMFVAAEIERLMAEERLGPSAFGVLYRTHAQSRAFEEAFVLRGIPYSIIGGLRFYERKEVKDLVAYLRLAANARDFIAFRRIVNVPRRGIGAVTAGRIEAFAGERGLDVYEALGAAGEIPGVGPKTRARVDGFAALMEELRSAAPGAGPRGLMELVLERTSYLRMLEDQGAEQATERAENIEELLSVAAGYPPDEEGLEAFLTDIALMSEADAYDEGTEAVSLMTLHSAKGLEFPVVFMAGMEEGVFPHQRSLEDREELEEERRLCYVGMTRAEDRLYLTRASRRMLFGTVVPREPSRFLAELPADVTSGAGRRPAGGRPERGAEEPSAEDVPRPGQKVQHHRWGIGTVVACHGDEEDAQVTVAFPGIGVKRLIVRYAALQRLE